jgi:hypothetical protein
MTEQDCERYELWPIAVNLDGDAFTLWGSAGGDYDLLLADGGELLAFRRWSELVKFVREAHRCNLLERPGYGGLRALLAESSREPEAIIIRYDFAEVEGWISRAGWPPTPESFSAALNCLNLLWDATRTIDDTEWVGRLQRNGGPLAALMDLLTFAEKRGDTQGRSWTDIAAEFSALLARVRGRWRVREG